MANHTKNLSPNTIAFTRLEPEVAVLIIDIIHAVFAVLGWRQSSKSLLAEILSRLAETDSFESMHAEFSAALWPEQDEKRRAEKMSRWVKRLKEDMELSKFQAVWIENRRVKRKDDGNFVGLPTLYKRADFWKLFRIVQDYAKDCDLLALHVRTRRASIRAVSATWLEKCGAVKIIREKIEKEKKEKPEKEKSDSLPCKCSCDHCYYCDLRDEAPERAAKSEAKNGAGRVDELRRLPNDSYPAMLEAFSEAHYQHLCDVGEVNSEFRFRVKRAIHALEVAELRAREMVVKNNKSGLRLVGGQPK